MPTKTTSQPPTRANKTSLSPGPPPPGCRKLQGSSHEDYRIRIGDYRVLYEIDDAAHVVRIMRVRHRREAYR